MENRIYLCIDLKSFYASVECVERGLDPLATNLVVADSSRTEKTICLAVTPSLKAYGISGRARLFEVVQRVKEVNSKRKRAINFRSFTGKSYDSTELKDIPELELDYIVAPPRMAFYMEYSTRIYEIYLKYIAHEDIHVYSIDEVFIDLTKYLKMYKKTAREIAIMIIRDVLSETGITATAGIGTNMYLAKIAMDIEAKHTEPDEYGVRIAELDEMSYRQKLWGHKPITDFWRVGPGYAKKLEAAGIYTMGDVAKCSVGKKNNIYNEDLLYKMFGVNAELLIDHAWGWEPCTIEDVKAYKPETNSISSGQVLKEPYEFEKAKLVIREMAELLALSLVEKYLVTNQIVIDVGYDIENLTNSKIRAKYKGETKTDRYGRAVPKHSTGRKSLARYTSSAKKLTEAVSELFDEKVNKDLLVRRMTITANNVILEKDVKPKKEYRQLDFFTDYDKLSKEEEQEENNLKREKNIQRAIVKIKKRYGKNAVVKGMNLQEGATAMERNNQIGGHKA